MNALERYCPALVLAAYGLATALLPGEEPRWSKVFWLLVLAAAVATAERARRRRAR